MGDCSFEQIELDAFVIILTDECNFNCTYCYQAKGRQRLESSALAKAIDFFYPYFPQGCFISFYGGEPLLVFDEIKRTVEYVERLPSKHGYKTRFSLTTNGSLLNDDILGFLDEHGFSLTLSFDGIAQDISRKKGSFNFLTSLVPQILARPRISLETNSVFSSETIGYLSESVRYIIQMGVRKLDVNFAHKPPWTSSSLLLFKEEIARVGKYFESQYEHLQDIPWTRFYKEPIRGVYQCSAGANQMAISAQGTLWGCYAFPHYFMNRNGTKEYEKFCFGDVDSFINNPHEIYAHKIHNYSDLQMDRFATADRSCLMCSEIEYCWICPLAAALSTGEIGRIPAWSCQTRQILRKEKRLLLNQFKKKVQRIHKTSSN